ncbi:MAG: C10 family peptidase [Rikenellaceae bacterium]|nr:C10 family peptidase [Rikenellaceae bacterium]
MFESQGIRTYGDVFDRPVRQEKEIESVTEIPDANGVTAYYIINYKGSGFLILAADNRVNPILAYSETNCFPVDSGSRPEGLVDWMNGTKEHIETVRAENREQSAEMQIAWSKAYTQNALYGPDEVDPDPKPGFTSCRDYDVYEQKGPMLKTQWDQIEGYNDLVPKNCGEGKALTGCFATAMAQVMRYYKHPNNYNWDAMPDNGGSTEIAVLMRDIGTAVKMDYGCDGSGATNKNAVSAFKNKFGYTSAKEADFYGYTVREQLAGGLLVLLSGGTKKGLQYVNGHMWVCDGYDYAYVHLDTFDCMQAYGRLLLHMNWGWGSNYDGWYDFNNWNPGTHEYNDRKKMIYELSRF